MSTAAQRQQVLALLSASDPPNERALREVLHDNFTHTFFPTSFGGFGKESRTREEFIDLLKQMFSSTLERFNFQVKDLVQGKGQNGEDVTIIHVIADGKLASGKSYTNEYIFICRFADDGKIVDTKEFFDTKYVIDAFAQ